MLKFSSKLKLRTIKYFLPIFIFFQISITHANQIEHKIAVLVNDKVITTYDIDQRMKMNAIINNIEISAENIQFFANSVVDEIIQEKLKQEKTLEYGISVSEEEYLEYEKNFLLQKNLSKEDFKNLFNINNIKYKNFRDFVFIEISWQKVISGLFYRLTSASDFEVEEIISKNPSINTEVAEDLVIQRQLDLKSSKLLRDLYNEATIEFK